VKPKNKTGVDRKKSAKAISTMIQPTTAAAAGRRTFAMF